MNEYIKRLQRTGMAPHEALRLVKAMIKDYGYREMEELTASMEKDAYVDRVQSKPHGTPCR